MSWPPTDTLPSVGLAMPQMMLISVVLPAPFGPSSAKISPLRISRLMPVQRLEAGAIGFGQICNGYDGGHGDLKYRRLEV